MILIFLMMKRMLILKYNPQIRGVLKKLFLLFFLSLSFNLWAEIILFKKYDFLIDLPEGYVLDEQSVSNFAFYKHTKANVLFMCVFRDKNDFDSLDDGYDFLLDSFYQAHSVKKESFIYADRPAFFMQFEDEFLTDDNILIKSFYYCLGLELERDLGYAILITIGGKETEVLTKSIMLSTLDGAMPYSISMFSPGPITSFFYPRKSPMQITQTFNNTKIRFEIDRTDSIANQYLVDREFEALLFCDDVTIRESAMKRFYRMIYRDSFGRLASYAQAVKVSFGKNFSPENVAKTMLSYIQDFEYVRNIEGSGFENLVDVAIKKRGDCDSRALLFAVVLQELKIPANIAISLKHKHALALVACEGEGARIQEHNISYLVGETTIKVALGRIAAEQANPADWVVPDLYGLPKDLPNPHF